MTKPKICLDAVELADAYALSTLHDYLKSSGFPARVSFCYRKNEEVKRIIEDSEYHDRFYHEWTRPLIV